MKPFLSFIKRIFSNRVALIFVVGHLSIVILALIDTYAKYGTLSYITGHTGSQTFLITALIAINLPALLLSLLAGLPLGWVFASIGIDSLGLALLYLICLFCINFQWALIGYGVDKILHRNFGKNISIYK